MKLVCGWGNGGVVRCNWTKGRIFFAVYCFVVKPTSVLKLKGLHLSSLARIFSRSKVHFPDDQGVCYDWSTFFTGRFSRSLWRTPKNALSSAEAPAEYLNKNISKCDRNIESARDDRNREKKLWLFFSLAIRKNERCSLKINWLACSRLWGSRVHWIKKARIWKNGRKMRRGRAAEPIIISLNGLQLLVYPLIGQIWQVAISTLWRRVVPVTQKDGKRRPRSRAFHFRVFPTILEPGTGY